MKRGSSVLVCHDGKLGRAVAGIVLQNRNNHTLRVGFFETDGSHTTLAARRTRRSRRYGGAAYRWSGWSAETDHYLPWYSVHKMRWGNLLTEKSRECIKAEYAGLVRLFKDGHLK